MVVDNHVSPDNTFMSGHLRMISVQVLLTRDAMSQDSVSNVIWSIAGQHVPQLWLAGREQSLDWTP